jgi:hypothetical protein
MTFHDDTIPERVENLDSPRTSDVPSLAELELAGAEDAARDREYTRNRTRESFEYLLRSAERCWFATSGHGLKGRGGKGTLQGFAKKIGLNYDTATEIPIIHTKLELVMANVDAGIATARARGKIYKYPSRAMVLDWVRERESPPSALKKARERIVILETRVRDLEVENAELCKHKPRDASGDTLSSGQSAKTAEELDATLIRTEKLKPEDVMNTLAVESWGLCANRPSHLAPSPPPVLSREELDAKLEYLKAEELTARFADSEAERARLKARVEAIDAALAETAAAEKVERECRERERPEVEILQAAVRDAKTAYFRGKARKSLREFIAQRLAESQARTKKAQREIRRKYAHLNETQLKALNLADMPASMAELKQQFRNVVKALFATYGSDTNDQYKAEFIALNDAVADLKELY